MKTENRGTLGGQSEFSPALILVRLALAHWAGSWWLLLTAFVGLNLVQSAFTGLCPAETIFQGFGVGRGVEK